MEETPLWLAFGSLLFLFMGLGLALDPSSHAQAAADWPSLAAHEKESTRALAAALSRAAGVLFLVLAAWLLAAACGLPLGPARRLALFRLAPPARLAAGAGAALLSLVLSALKMAEWVHGSGKTARHRVSFWSGWGVVFTLMAFGALQIARANLVQ